MKGIVMEKKNNNLIVLTNSGEFKEVKYQNKVNIGDEIIISNSFNNAMIRRVVAMAAAFIMIVTAGYGVYGYYTPYGYINVDINPSVELSYNLYNRVIDMKGLNDDGNLVVKDLVDYKNKSIDSVINKIVDSAIDHNYISPDKENAVLVTVIEESKKVNEDKIIKSVNAHIDEKKTVAELMVLEAKNKPVVKKEENVSPGKSLLISKALESNDKLDYNEVSKKPIKDIIEIIKNNNHESNKEKNKEVDKDKNQNNEKINNKNSNNEKDKENNSNKEKKDNKNSNKDIEKEKQEEKNKNKEENKDKDKKNDKSEFLQKYMKNYKNKEYKTDKQFIDSFYDKFKNDKYSKSKDKDKD